jgi:hypothetical protein
MFSAGFVENFGNETQIAIDFWPGRDLRHSTALSPEVHLGARQLEIPVSSKIRCYRAGYGCTLKDLVESLIRNGK